MVAPCFWQEKNNSSAADPKVVRSFSELLALLFQTSVKSEVLPEYTKKLLAQFRAEDLPPESYLGGGTAIAL